MAPGVGPRRHTGHDGGDKGRVGTYEGPDGRAMVTRWRDGRVGKKEE